ncbi:innexin inx2 isoform X1 [Hyalella azteca]|uniref:Innexin n=1 Tax=Hyalella azteca TaxID=294128 RepID=A0A8B7NT34_HYAAZ|nr:innexin inx2 isoform X1 [Hyalella azteca]
MFSLFDDLKKQISFKHEHPTVDSTVFTSMKLSMVGTLLACILVTAKTYIGENINCVTGFKAQEHKAIETYCFISSTFSLVNVSEADAPYPGLGPVPSSGEEDPLKRHAYYQWIPLALAIQTAALYFPRWLWKTVIDRKKFKNILGDLDSLHLKNEGGNEEEKSSAEAKPMSWQSDTDDIKEYGKPKKTLLNLPEELLEKSVHYAVESLGTHTAYAARFFMCEVIALVISIGNLFVTNALLGGDFFEFGNTAISYLFGDVTDLTNPLNVVFPKITKCTWSKFGPTGSIQSFDALCVLPLNIVNEKTYVMLWLVYIVSTTIAAAAVLWHFLLILSSGLRHNYLVLRLKDDETKEVYSSMKKKLNYGDWFLIKHLSTKMMPTYFEAWLEMVDREIKK